MHTGNLASAFRYIRDVLLNPNHGDVSLQELIFFGNGLFKHGKLDYSQDTADETLNRILIPLATDDERYTDLLIMNAANVRKIVEKASESIIDFKESLDSKCPSIFNVPEMKQFSEKLNEKYAVLKKKFSPEESNKEEVKE